MQMYFKIAWSMLSAFKLQYFNYSIYLLMNVFTYISGLLVMMSVSYYMVMGKVVLISYTSLQQEKTSGYYK
jgi:hypothetical protein